jgi:adenylate cyclase
MSTQEVKRKLAAILSADVKGYSRLMGGDEEWTVRTLSAYREIMRGLVQQHRGRVVDTPGDNVLAEFASVVDAVQCSVEIQQVLRAKNAVLPENRRMEFRIGINLGDVIEEGDSIYGDGVNIAARLEGLADAGGICISESAYQQIENKVPLRYQYLGEHQVKNISKPVRAYRAQIEPEVAGKVIGEKKVKPRQWQRVAIGLVVAVIVVVGAVVIWKLYTPSAPQPEVASKEKITTPQPEKPSATIPTAPAPAVETAPKEKVMPPSPQKVSKTITPSPLVDKAHPKKIALPLYDKPSIAVLPFVNMSEDPKQEFLSDGISEEIINALVRWPPILVIPRSSTFIYKGKSIDVKRVGQEMGVRYVLEGSVRREENRVRITAQLVDASTLQHLFSERYERDMKDIFAIQDEITMKILAAMRVSLYGDGVASLPGKRTKNIEAYVKILEAGVFAQVINRASLAHARRLAEEAIALDPGYARAYSTLAGAIANEVSIGVYENRREALERAMPLAEKGVQLDDSSGVGHGILGVIAIYLNRDYEKAIAEGERAVALEPNSVLAQYLLGMFLNWGGRTEEAIPILKKAVSLSPIPHPNALSNLAQACRIARRYEEAVAACRQALQREPNHMTLHLTLAATFAEMGKMEEARAEATEVLRIDPKYTPPRPTWKDQAEVDRYIDALRKAGLK